VEIKSPVITIDGPSGVGKGTISQLLAEKLGWHLLDSGALYRVLALAAHERGIQLDNESGLFTLAEHLDVQFQVRDGREPVRVMFEGGDVTDSIRTETRGSAASIIAKLPAVREGLLNRQKDFCQPPGLVAEGRDMGTVVFADAPLKLFLTASPEERAKRRYEQLKSKGVHVKIADLAQEIAERDERDSRRVVAPLKPAEDAVVIDTTTLSIDEVLARVLEEVEREGFPIGRV